HAALPFCQGLLVGAHGWWVQARRHRCGGGGAAVGVVGGWLPGAAAVGDVLLEELVDVRELGVGGVVGGGCGAGDVLRLVGGACGWPVAVAVLEGGGPVEGGAVGVVPAGGVRSEEHTSELQSREKLVC